MSVELARKIELIETVSGHIPKDLFDLCHARFIGELYT
jgi:hypothetical protein